VAELDSQIDSLYRLPLEEFTAARTALAKTLKGDAARDVRALKKPTTVPWAVNQVYWKARPTYDAAMKAGQALRHAQIATLKGKKADVRAATEAHRRTIAAAVREAAHIASSAGVNPNAEQLARMFEAVSLAAAPAESTGRFTEVIEPSGFDALTGITPTKRVHVEPAREPEAAGEKAAPPSKADRAAETRRLEEERRQQREAEERLNTATRELERARTRAESARRALERADADVAAAEREVESARASATSASRRRDGESR
jgi:hypothetical protein